MGKNKGNKAVVNKTAATKYDKKMQARREQEALDKKQARIIKSVAAAAVAAVIAGGAVVSWVNYDSLNNEYIVVDNESVSGVEFDLYYYLTKSETISSYGSYLSYYLGYNSNLPDSAQTFEGDQTWFDYFAESTVDKLKEYKALVKDADATGYEYTSYEEDLKNFKDNLESLAEEAGVSVNQYLKANYGNGVTYAKLEKQLYNYLKAEAYKEAVDEKLKSTEAEALEYYNEHKNNYDYVKYRVLEIKATDANDKSTYEKAKNEANEMLNAIDSEEDFIKLCPKYAADSDKYKDNDAASLITDGFYSVMEADMGDYLFDDKRVEGDKTVIENEETGVYSVVYFIDKENGYDKSKDSIELAVLNNKYKEYIDEKTKDMTWVNKYNRIEVNEE